MPRAADKHIRTREAEFRALTVGGNPAANTTNEQVLGYCVRLDLPFSLPTPFYGAMIAIWQLRPVLQRRFPLHHGRSEDFLRFLAWCVHDGRREYAILRSIEEWDDALCRPATLPVLAHDRWGQGFTVGMYLVAIARNQYSTKPVLFSANARARAARAYWRGEPRFRVLPDPPAWQIDWLRSEFRSVQRFIKVIQRPRVDEDKTLEQLITAFGLDTTVPRFSGAAHESDHADPVPNPVPFSAMIAERFARPLDFVRLRLRKSIQWMVNGVRRAPNEFQLSGVTGRIPSTVRRFTGTHHPFGVNLFGYARGELGIGEDVRLVAQALNEQGIPFCVVNVQPGASVSQKDRSIESWIVDQPQYAINIFSMTGIEHVRLVCEKGPELLAGRFNIGLWPWELPRWPSSWSHAFGLVDEIWGISNYTAAAYAHSPVTVLTVPMPVTVRPVADVGRSQFGLPETAFLFVFSFDLNSTLARKNPLAVVKAFQQAFPRESQTEVGLVLKVSHTTDANPEWRKLKAIIRRDPRIHLIDTVLRRPMVLALYRCCDCFVSLHRAEGFGRGLAEAMLLGLPVIATGFSGNLDFCISPHARLVRYHNREIKAGEYFFSQGQSWAEPSVDHAAELMREIKNSPRPAAERPDFSPRFAGRAYARRLGQLRKKYDFNEIVSHCS